MSSISADKVGVSDNPAAQDGGLSESDALPETPDQAYLFTDNKGQDYIATVDGKTVMKWEDVIEDIFR